MYDAEHFRHVSANIQKAIRTVLDMKFAFFIFFLSELYKILDIFEHFLPFKPVSQGRSGLPCDFDADLW